MSAHFCISVTFLDAYFHGQRDGGEPEWPPSPLRLFQAMVAATALGRRLDTVRPALRWLEGQPSPVIIAPHAETTSSYVLSVPNNAMDLVAKAWSRGNYFGGGDANPATHRTMKTVRAKRLADGCAVHYLWRLPDPLTDEVSRHIELLSAAAGSLVALGWGVDLVAGQGRLAAQEEADALSGERWTPFQSRDSDRLRSPVPGTLIALERRHQAFLNLLVNGRFNPPSPLTTFDLIGYRRATDPPPRPYVAFEILSPLNQSAASRRRVSFDAGNTTRVAGMVRNALACAADANGWPMERINELIHGHTPDGNGPAHNEPNAPRFAYAPLPSIELRGAGDGPRREHIGNILRVMVIGAPGMQKEIAWARQALSGHELIKEGEDKPVGFLSPLTAGDPAVSRYAGTSAVWSTVTPMILPGYDDPAHLRRKLAKLRGNADAVAQQKRLLAQLDNRIDGLIRKAIFHAGFSGSLAVVAEIDWRKVGFRAGVERVDCYHVPEKLAQFSRYHVRIRWRDAAGQDVQLRGPLVIGGGRFRGLGLFAPEQ